LRSSRPEPRRSIRIGDSAAPVWLSFRGLFRAIHESNAGLNIPAHNGGLFAPDPALDALQVSGLLRTSFQPHRKSSKYAAQTRFTSPQCRLCARLFAEEPRHRAGAGTDVQLVVDVAQVRLHRQRANSQRLGDLLCPVALGDQAQDFLLAVREVLLRP
jgi:hypothetical protein